MKSMLDACWRMPCLSVLYPQYTEGEDIELDILAPIGYYKMRYIKHLRITIFAMIQDTFHSRTANKHKKISKY